MTSTPSTEDAQQRYRQLDYHRAAADRTMADLIDQIQQAIHQH